jgi:hypothetical protein
LIKQASGYAVDAKGFAEVLNGLKLRRKENATA